MTQDIKKRPAVLIVEDEPLLRMDAVDMIGDAGFRTYEAGTAAAAITIMETHSDIGILFTDIDMPGSMDGLQLAAHVHQGWPQVAIVIASGVVEIEKVGMPEGAMFFSKPYASSQVTRTLQDIADRQ
ncbi:response regulator [Puniceibacterium confluentis]|uniref:response regulator n=1 Tax=Puniceibacterium confluentis TaxID=1958944 RepID=UPI0016471390|nr:response regulator [Puniceibacterium confluentis]